MSRRLVLASGSPARLALLTAAGVRPQVVVSGVDEDDVSGQPDDVALTLARRKAAAVAALPESRGALVLGCDSVLDLDGEVLGKPDGADEAVARWIAMRGRQGVLVSGHCLLDVDEGGSVRGEAAAVARTSVRFGTPDDEEVAAYVATGEPQAVAGAFTIDGLGGWWVDSVDGAPSTVVGLSLPVLRDLLARLGTRVTDLWGDRDRSGKPGQDGRPEFADG